MGPPLLMSPLVRLLSKVDMFLVLSSVETTTNHARHNTISITMATTALPWALMNSLQCPQLYSSHVWFYAGLMSWICLGYAELNHNLTL
jgi:hypothetical protein